MKVKINLAVVLFVLSFLPVFSSSNSKAEIDKQAPNFTLTDSNGKLLSLSDFKGKFVVLEWVNFECPFVKKQYNSKNMQMLQKEFTDKGVVWLSINSSAENKQGNFSSEEINKRIKEHGASMTAYLIDASGEVGKMYGAKTTPHIYVINPDGFLIYAGAIDDKPSTNIDDISGAKNYVRAALESAMSEKEVNPKVTSSYGCPVKY